MIKAQKLLVRLGKWKFVVGIADKASSIQRSLTADELHALMDNM